MAVDELSKLSLLEISRKLVLNVISIDDKSFKYTCNEAGIRCNPDMHTRGLMGYIQEIEKKWMFDIVVYRWKLSWSKLQ